MCAKNYRFRQAGKRASLEFYPTLSSAERSFIRENGRQSRHAAQLAVVLQSRPPLEVCQNLSGRDLCY